MCARVEPRGQRQPIHGLEGILSEQIVAGLDAWRHGQLLSARRNCIRGDPRLQAAIGIYLVEHVPAPESRKAAAAS